MRVEIQVSHSVDISVKLEGTRFPCLSLSLSLFLSFSLKYRNSEPVSRFIRRAASPAVNCAGYSTQEIIDRFALLNLRERSR
jgi:hypothetical protein